MDQVKEDVSPRLDAGAGVTSAGMYRSIDGFDLEMLQVRPDGAGPFPALCLFFGGGWSKGSPLQFAEQAKYLSSRGISVFLPDYRVTSRHGSRLSQSLEDATAAFAWLVQNAAALNINPDQIALGGGSAGGYLATAVAFFGADAQNTAGKPPAALVLFNPALDLNGLTPAVLKALAEPSGPLHGVRLADYTLEGRISAALPPALIMHGRADGIVSYESVERVVRAASLAGNDWCLVAYEGQQHGFFNHPSVRADGPSGWQFAATLEQIDLFLAAQGWLSGPSTLSTIVSWPRPNKAEA